MSNARLVCVLFTLVFSALAQASPNADALGRCLSDNTSGKDRKDLARWIFVGMAAHPEIGNVAKASPEAVDAAQRTVGALVTRLIADACPNETRAVVKADGMEGIKSAFEYLGKMAMQELMSNPQVGQTIGGFEQHIDKARVEAVVSSK